jgi:hypothetical protein
METLFSAIKDQRRLPKDGRTCTIDGQISQRSTGGALHFDIGALQKGEDGLERVSVDFSDI